MCGGSDRWTRCTRRPRLQLARQAGSNGFQRVTTGSDGSNGSGRHRRPNVIARVLKIRRHLQAPQAHATPVCSVGGHHWCSLAFIPVPETPGHARTVESADGTRVRLTPPSSAKSKCASQRRQPSDGHHGSTGSWSVLATPSGCHNETCQPLSSSERWSLATNEGEVLQHAQS